MTYDTPQFDHPVRNQLSSDALEWYDEKTLERDLTRDEFNMFILEVIDPTALAAGSQLESLTKERDEYKERMQRLMTTVTDIKATGEIQ